LKLPPPPCAVLLVYYNRNLGNIMGYIYIYIIYIYICLECCRWVWVKKIGVPPNSRYSSARKTLFIFWIWYQPFSGDNFDLSTTPAEKPRSCTMDLLRVPPWVRAVSKLWSSGGITTPKTCVFWWCADVGEWTPKSFLVLVIFSETLVWGFPYFSLPSFQTPRAWGPHPPVLVATRGRSPRLPSSTPRITRWIIWMVYMIPCG